MSKTIKSMNEYREAISRNQESQREAFEYALDTRKFEIDLYWRRATYFWALIAAAFGAFFVLSSSKNLGPFLPFVAGCIGLVLSVGWFLVNRGSKYWQTNWERHVDCLEDQIVGPLYKTTISKEEFDFLSPIDGYPYSVSKVNQLISLFVVCIWLALIASTALTCFANVDAVKWGVVLVSILTVGFTLALLGCALTGSQQNIRRVNFVQAEIGSSD